MDHDLRNREEAPLKHGNREVGVPEPSQSAAYVPVREYTLAVTFRADHETALRAKDALETTMNALALPNEAHASALFKLGCEAVVSAAEEVRRVAA